MKNYNLWLFVILFIGFVLRVAWLSSIPKSLSMDEVTFGYAAYSVLKTGYDEYGKFLPMAFRGMGDYKPPVDVYIKIPFIILFGLNEFTIRLPGVIAGLLTIYFLIKMLRKNEISDPASLLAGLWLAVSPWHIFYSRAGYEAVTALFFFVLGLYFFSEWKITKKFNFFIVFLVAFSLSTWAYHAERVFIPIFTFLLLYNFRKLFYEEIISKRKLFKSLAVLFVFAGPFFYGIFVTNEISPRAWDLWFTKEIENANFYQIIRSWIGQYLQYFDMKFIFWKAIGLTPKGYPDVGLLSLIDAVIVITGLYVLAKSKAGFLKTATMLTLVLGPLPAAFARGDPSPIRILVWAPAFAILLALGFDRVLKNRLRKKIVLAWLAVSLIYLSYFFYLYKYDFDKYYADLWHYGYKEAANYICKNHDKYNKIILTDKYGIELSRIKTIPHYYILFHCKHDPAKYLENRNLMNIEIRPPQWRIDSKNPDYLLIGSPRDFPENIDKALIFKIIYFPNGKEALYFVRT